MSSASNISVGPKKREAGVVPKQAKSAQRSVPCQVLGAQAAPRIEKSPKNDDQYGQDLIGQYIYIKCSGWADNHFLNPYFADSDKASASASPEEQVGGNVWAKWLVRDSGTYPYVMLQSAEQPEGRLYYLAATNETAGAGYRVKALDSVDPENDDMLLWKMELQWENENEYIFQSLGMYPNNLRLGSQIDPDAFHLDLHLWYPENETIQRWTHFRPEYTSGYESVVQLQNDTSEAVSVSYEAITGYTSMAGESTTIGGGMSTSMDVEIKTFFTLGYEVAWNAAWTEYQETSFTNTTILKYTISVPANTTFELFQLTGTYSDYRVLGSHMYGEDVLTKKVVFEITPAGARMLSEAEGKAIREAVDRIGAVQRGGGRFAERARREQKQKREQQKPEHRVQPVKEYTAAQRSARDKMVGQIIYIRADSHTNHFVDCDTSRSAASARAHPHETVGGEMWSKWEVVDMADYEPYIALRSVDQDYHYLTIEGSTAQCNYHHNPRDQWIGQYWMDFEYGSETRFQLRTRIDQKYLSVGNKVSSSPDKYDLVKKEWDQATMWEVFTPENGSGYETVSFFDNTNSSSEGQMQHTMVVGYESSTGGSVDVGIDISVKMGVEVQGFFTSQRQLNFNAQWQSSWSQTFSTTRTWQITIPVPPHTMRRLRQLIGSYDDYGIKSSYYIVDEDADHQEQQ